jgi:hypothetical protein
MASLVTRLVFASSTVVAVTFLAVPAGAQVKDEAAPSAQEAAAAVEAAPAAATEAAKPDETAEPPKCDCPPPCPVPPPPPPAPPLPPAPTVEWKAQTKGGMLITGGNSQSKNFTVGVNASRKEGDNKLALEGGLNYGTSNNSAAIAEGGVITEVYREKVVSANNWAAKGRYDRFVTPNNSAFASGLAAADKVAGKSFFGGGQIGYSRQLVKDELNTLVAELGYDFSYERYVAGNDPVVIHSARVFVGETLSLTKDTGVTASLEALFNLNKENKAINAKDGSVGVAAFKDTRVNGKMQLTTNLWKSLGFGFGVGFKYDQNPAPRPVPSNVSGAKWPAQYWSLAYAQHWDLITEATLLYTFF